ncbi:hypothetical protein N7I40_004057 [Vibrio parahaemolyticus]|uniref:hypothetical protein n=1 Tax=Vibrio alginolyticus TaxID=663 RepID=UPI00063D88AE|nr:hypothetical protein [Vibrio alginolyticus]EGR3221685.1 hypothetical protein [Vibrio parahaemolyticus]EHK6545798.1 hypothetical protein [Vibrio parahaemolyticus]EJV5946430.1 hypothetical protein [Vibrio parahaemolyticus]ELA7322591.1 hypothetical protein [Vibrio parahaemolyticus]ELJ1804447.1 hypothetical protein [Vibrio parahaemolyticus]
MSEVTMRVLKEPSERVKITISPATYTNNDKGEIVLKNSARMRLMLDKTLLREQDFICDRLKLIHFDEDKMFLMFKVSDDGIKTTTMGGKDHPKLEVSIPLSRLKTLKHNDFPKIRRAPCAYRFLSEERLIVLLPLKRLTR